MEDTGKCTCGMELGKKLASVQHLLAGSPTLKKGGESITIDLRSSSPWSTVGASDYFELELKYGPTDKEGLKVQIDSKGDRFKIGGKEGDMPGLQAEVEQRQLMRMITDLLGMGCPAEAKTKLETLRDMHGKGERPKLGDSFTDEKQRDLARRIDASSERWWANLAGLTEHELTERLAKNQALADDGDPFDARRDLEALADALPHHDGVKRQLAAIYLHSFSDFKLREAVRLLEHVRGHQPDDFVTEELWGDAQLKQGDAGAAKKAYQHAHELAKGESAWALFGLGQVAELEGDFGAARQFYVSAGRKAHEPGLRRCLEQMDARVTCKLKKAN